MTSFSNEARSDLTVLKQNKEIRNPCRYSTLQSVVVEVVGWQHMIGLLKSGHYEPPLLSIEVDTTTTSKQAHF